MYTQQILVRSVERITQDTLTFMPMYSLIKIKYLKHFKFEILAAVNRNVKCTATSELVHIVTTQRHLKYLFR
jgi:hypothetical protein